MNIHYSGGHRVSVQGKTGEERNRLWKLKIVVIVFEVQVTAAVLFTVTNNFKKKIRLRLNRLPL